MCVCRLRYSNTPKPPFIVSHIHVHLRYMQLVMCFNIGAVMSFIPTLMCVVIHIYIYYKNKYATHRGSLCWYITTFVLHFRYCWFQTTTNELARPLKLQMSFVHGSSILVRPFLHLTRRLGLNFWSQPGYIASMCLFVSNC